MRRVLVVGFTASLGVGCGSDAPTTAGGTGDTGEDTTASEPAECAEDLDCPDERPQCSEGVCLACADLESCEAHDPATPACHEPSGRCLPCLPDGDTCSGDMPHCTGAGQCVQCLDSTHCPDSACNRFTGTCMPTDSVYWVFNSTQDEWPDPDGTVNAPFGSIQEVLQTVGDEQVTIWIAGSAYIEAMGMTIEGPRTVAIREFVEPTFGDDELDPLFGGGLAAMTVTGGARVIVEEVDVTEHEDVAIDCFGADLWLVNLGLMGGTGTGLRAVDCDVHLSGVHVGGNDRGAITTSGNTTLSIVNSVIGLNGVPLATEGTALELRGGTAEIVHSTIAANYGEPDRASVLCSGAALRIHNSIVTSFDASIDCPQAQVDHSVVDTPSLSGDGVFIADFNPQWFNSFGAGRTRVRWPTLADPESSPMAGVAQWALGDPLTDIDGDPRPAVDGSEDYAGCERPPL
ncbi:MAG: hypothetical protein AAF799_13205 [Myxococcota bacterium]